MKINNSIIIGLMIGLVVGGLAIGILDAKRPKPIFSHASEGDVCASYQDSIKILAASRDRTTDVASIDNFNASITTLVNAFELSGCRKGADGQAVVSQTEN